MRNISTALALLVALLTSPVVVSAQRTAADQNPVASRDNSKVPAVQNLVISADGSWVAAEEYLDHGDANVRVWSTDGDERFTIERGHSPRISPDSRWVSAFQKPAVEASETGKPKEHKRTGQTLVLLDTQDGSRRMFDSILSYDLTDFSSYLVYLQSTEARADKERHSRDEKTNPAVRPEVNQRDLGTLQVEELESGRVFTWHNVASYATREITGHYAYLALVTHDNESGRDRLEVAFVGHAKWGSGTGGTYDGKRIEGLYWARNSIRLGFLDHAESTGKDGKPRVSSALHMWHDIRGRSGFRAFTRVDQGDSELGALHNLVISPDGAWMAAEEHPDHGDGNVRVWSTETDVAITIESGQNPRISRDSRWLSALQNSLFEESRSAAPTNQRAGQTLVLLDMQDGSRRTFDFVQSYDLAYASTYLIYLQSPETPAADEKRKRRGALHLVHLESDTVSAGIENVVQHAAHQPPVVQRTTDHVAYVAHDEGTGRDTLNILALGRNSGWGHRGTYKGASIEGLCWARDPITIGFLDTTATTADDDAQRVSSAVYTWHVSGPNVQGRFTRVDVRGPAQN